MSGVARETAAVAREYGLPASAAARIDRLLEALAAEPDPHTTVSEPARAIDIHVRDSLSALELPAVAGAHSIVDLGAGPGFPGLPLALALPNAHVDLVESAGRKCAVIERLAAAAKITNARAVHARVEDWAAGDGRVGYDIATARALAPLAVLLEYAAPLLAPEGTLVAWKGSVGDDEIEAAERAAGELGLEARAAVRVAPFKAARDLHLHLYSKVRDTPPQFPRRAGMASKRPLGARNHSAPPLT